MRISLNTAWSRWLFLALLVSVSGSLAVIAGRVWLAEYWSASSDPHLWLYSAQLEPGNSAYWDHLGLYALLDCQHDNVHQALDYLKRAAGVNPHSDTIWVELAGVYENAGNPIGARRAYAEAQSDYPISANVAWRYGSFLIRQGSDSEGFAEIRRAIARDPSLTEGAVSECWEARGNAEVLLNQVLPEKNTYYLVALNFFLSRKNWDAALHVWQGLLMLGQPLEMEAALPLVDGLISANRVADAEKVWKDALEATHWPKSSNRGNNLVFNGGFERQPADGGFDWREQGLTGVSYALDKAVTHSGAQSMKVTFDGSANFDFAHLRQYVAVEPNQRYRFTAYLRTDGITTDSGVRFAIDDVHQPSEGHVLTSNLIGTNAWMLVQANIATDPDTDLLAVSLRRIPSQKFDNKLAGTVWVDDVSLVPITGKAGEVHLR